MQSLRDFFIAPKIGVTPIPVQPLPQRVLNPTPVPSSQTDYAGPVWFDKRAPGAAWNVFLPAMTRYRIGR